MLGQFRSHYCGEGGDGGGGVQHVRYEQGIPAQPTDPPTPGAGCDECLRHDGVKRYYLTREDETWETVQRPGRPAETTAPVRAPPRHVESPRLPCLPSCGERPHCEQQRVAKTSAGGATVEQDRKSVV